MDTLWLHPDHDDAAMCHIGGGSDISNCQLTKSLLKSRGKLDKSVQELFPDKLHYLRDPAYRPQQISLVIDRLLADPLFGSLINPNQIGVMGQSFGGWTAEALAGAEIDCSKPESYSSSVCEAPDKDLATSVNSLKVCCQEPYRAQITHFRDKRVILENGNIQCVRCKRWLPTGEFHRHEGVAFERASRCRRCTSESRRTDRLSGSGTPRNVFQRRLAKAVELGRISKPSECEKCHGRFIKHQLVGHHHNGYEKWDDVLWLCRRCHSGEHASYL